jgi:hypothetical protein
MRRADEPGIEMQEARYSSCRRRWSGINTMQTASQQ